MSAQDKVTQEWDAMAGEWDDMASGYRDEFVRLLWQETETGRTQSSSSRKDLVVLDFGCATGLFTEVVRRQVARVIAMDVAPSMIGVLRDKIRAGEWDNVQAFCAVAAKLDPTVQQALEEYKGKVDIVAASSVLSFVPEEDMEATMLFLNGMLKPGTGVLFHTDWLKGEDHPDGFTEEKALEIYKKGGLEQKTTKTIAMNMMGMQMPVFVGLASKNS